MPSFVNQVVFTNELGNTITLSVVEKPIDGVQFSTKRHMKHLPGVLISMEGPTSLSENHITRMEAEVLFEQLRRALGKS